MAEVLQQTVKGVDIDNVFIFGNHSNTQVAYINEGTLQQNPGEPVRVADHFSDEEYQAMLKRVQNRGAEIIKFLQVSSAMSAAEATAKHLRDWLGAADESRRMSAFSMGILLQESVYGLAPGIVYSLPCVRSDSAPCGYTIRSDLVLPETTLALMRTSETELLEERSEVAEYL
jgi:malate/lactate dehydrogenase